MTDPTPTIDYRKLTPTFLKGIFAAELELVEKHKRAAELMYEMMAALAYHAPLVRPAEVRRFSTFGLAIVQPTHWLVYHAEEKNRVRVYASDAYDPVSVPPRPVGIMIPTGRTRQTRPNHDMSETEFTYLALYRSRLLGEWGASRCVTELTARQ